jgi:CRP/FNR family transcriptional regulator, cyclic AMP receptor protein
MAGEAPTSPPFCVCKHSIGAHSVGPHRRCGFCKCLGFSLPEPPIPPVDGLTHEVMSALEILAQNPAFAKVEGQHIANVGRHGNRRLFMAGDILMVEGASSDSLYFLVRGKVVVEVGIGGTKHQHVAELGPGEFVGEMGALLHKPRSATVTALGDLETLELGLPQIKQIFRDDHEILLAFVRIIQQRQHALDN